jgi:hypothetical protein
VKKALGSVDVDALLREIQRYLRYVDAFRAQRPDRPVKRTRRREG